MSVRGAITILLTLLSVVLFAQAAGDQTGQRTGPVIREIRVEGNQVIDAATIISAMRWKPGMTYVPTETTSEEGFILSLGFFRDAVVSAVPTEDAQVDILVRVNEFPVIKEVRVVGNTVLTTEQITEIVTKNQALGAIYNARNGRLIAQEIEATYDGQGVPAQIEQVGPDRESPGTLTVAVLEPRIRNVMIVKQDGTPIRTQQAVIEKNMRTRPGSVLNRQQIRADLEQLFSTRWFETLEPTTPLADRVGEFDLVIEVTEAPTGLFNAGVALDPQSRLVGQLSYSDSHFRGTGVSVGAQLSQAAAGGGASVDLAYGNRFLDDKGSSINYSLFSRVVYNFTGSGTNVFGETENARGFDERRTGFDISFGRPLTRSLRTNLGVSFENIKSLDLGTPIDPNDPNNGRLVRQDGDVAFLRIGLADDRAFPRLQPFRGSVASVTLEPGYSNITRVSGNVGGIDDVIGRNFFLRATAEYRYYWSRPVPEDTPIDRARPVFAARAQLGAISGKVPFFEQLFVGGAESLRGYDNQQFWGSRSVLVTAEWRQPLQSRISLVGFLDYGGAWGGYGNLVNFPQSRTPRFRLGYGVGVGLDGGPLGLIRLDFAFNEQGKNKLHFSLGTSF